MSGAKCSAAVFRNGMQRDDQRYVALIAAEKACGNARASRRMNNLS